MPPRRHRRAHAARCCTAAARPNVAKVTRPRPAGSATLPCLSDGEGRRDAMPRRLTSVLRQAVNRTSAARCLLGSLFVIAGCAHSSGPATEAPVHSRYPGNLAKARPLTRAERTTFTETSHYADVVQ